MMTTTTTTANILTDQDQKSNSNNGKLNLSASSRMLLNDNRTTIPRIGLGVAESEQDTYQAVRWALDVGYRLIDTASHESYGNEREVGQAIRDSGLNRSDVFVTTKLWDSDHGFYETIEAFQESWRSLDISYIDLYLIHSPFGGYITETWDALLYLRDQYPDKIKSIGVSNFGIHHLQALTAAATATSKNNNNNKNRRPWPAVNQFELHPLIYHKRRPLLDFCRAHNIQVQAFGSLLYGHEEYLTAPILTQIASRHDKSPQQVLLRWALQHDILVIPKSVRLHRIHDNINVFDFELDEEEMDRLDHWGDEFLDNYDGDDDSTSSAVLMYKEEWNWNPIDDASVHLGDTQSYWPTPPVLETIKWWDQWDNNKEEDDDDDDDETEEHDDELGYKNGEF